jgi:crossover junction endodeoxyribonuclease RusA
VVRPFTGRIEIAYSLHPKLPQDWRTRARKDPDGWEDTVMCMDLDNANKVLLDALKGVVFEDDKWVRKITAQRGKPMAEACLLVFVAPQKVQPVQAGLEIAS